VSQPNRASYQEAFRGSRDIGPTDDQTKVAEEGDPRRYRATRGDCNTCGAGRCTWIANSCRQVRYPASFLCWSLDMFIESKHSTITGPAFHDGRDGDDHDDRDRRDNDNGDDNDR
jgi:hypothetical protein